MKKIILLSFLLSITALQADFVRFEMGGGVWSHSNSGSIKHKNDKYPVDLSDDLDSSITQDIYLWAFLKHPVPVLPNIRLEYTNTVLDGSGSGFVYNGHNYASSTKYELTIQQIDAILYYNILDNLAWITLDIGLDINFMDQSYQFDNESSVSDSLAIPMLYGRGRFEIPGTGFGLECEAKYFTYADSTVGDIRAKIDYTFDIPVIQPAIELGYRYENIKTSLDDFSDLRNDTDITMSGVYLGAMFRF